ncbi:MAG: hypothetical protein GPOALKHO_000930 [Sodalis sp.]|nr:MAG: hypothetical protein GPOALKHO_000930 [Sodalis sp.]
MQSNHTTAKIAIVMGPQGGWSTPQFAEEILSLR